MANIKGGKYLINLLINFLGVNMNIITEKNEYYYDKTTGLILPQSNIIKNILKIKSYKLCYFSNKFENSIIFFNSENCYKIWLFSSTTHFNKENYKISTNFNKAILLELFQ